MTSVFCTRCGGRDVDPARHAATHGHAPVLPDPDRFGCRAVDDGLLVRVGGSWRRDLDVPLPGDL